MRSRPIVTLTLATLAACLASVIWIGLVLGDDESGGDSNTAHATVLVQETSLRVGVLPQTVTAYGTVQADASARNTLMAPVAARVGAVYVHLGQEVARGAPLLQLVPTAPTASAYSQAVVALKVATDATRRLQELLGEQLATRQQVADAQKSESDARAALGALTKQGASGPASVRAPFHAIVTALPIATGALVTEGTQLLELAPPGELVLLVGVVPAQARAIRAGDATEVRPVGSAQSFSGRVMLRGAVVDATTGLVPVQISLPQGALFPGETAQAAITIGQVHGYIVPHPAILVDESGDTYIVQTQKLIAKIVHVRVLGTHGAEDIIAGPLDAAAPVVLAGNHQLQDGMKVRLSDTR